MRIVFIVPASDIRRGFLYRLGYRLYGPSNSITGPLILGSLLSKAGHDVSVYEEMEEDVDYTRLGKPDAVCIYTMTSNAVRAYEIADFFRQRRGARVIIGGLHASVRPEETLEHADQVVVGEAENAILAIIEGRETSPVVRPEPVYDLDSLPFPDYSLLRTRSRAANILTSRGCHHRCNFCSSSRMFSPYRQRSVDSVIKELRYYRETGFRMVNFQDDNFTADRPRAKQILRAMIEHGLVFKETFFFGRSDIGADDELLELLAAANLNRVLIGLESLNQDSLDAVNKNQTVADIRRVGEKLQRYRIRLLAGIVLGLDTDRVEHIRRMVDFCASINTYQLQPAILTPYPGTPIYEQFEREGRIVIRDWQYYDMMNAVFKPRYMSSADLQKEFYLSLQRFYAFSGLAGIVRTFGLRTGFRRLLFMTVIRLVVFQQLTAIRFAGIRSSALFRRIFFLNLEPRPGME